MKRVNKTSFYDKTSRILRSNEGTSLVLVSVIAILIITGVVILRITSGNLWASADKQYNQDRAYVMATSMAESIDVLIHDGSIKLANYTGKVSWTIDSTKVSIEPYGEGYLLTIESDSAGTSYVYMAYYAKSGRSGSYTRHVL